MLIITMKLLLVFSVVICNRSILESPQSLSLLLTKLLPVDMLLHTRDRP